MSVLSGYRARSVDAGRVPPGPPFRATPKMLRMLAMDRLALMMYGTQFGDATRMSIGPKTLYLFNHPDYAKRVLTDNAANYHKGIGLIQARRALGDGLLTSEGELWRRQRKVVAPVFQPKRIAGQVGVIVDEVTGLVKRLRDQIGQGPVDVVSEVTGLTLGVLGGSLIDADLGDFGSFGHSFEVVQDQAMFEMVTLSTVPSWVPLPKQLRFRRAQRYLQRVVDTLVDDRIARSGEKPAEHDVLSRLIASTQADEDQGRRRQLLRDELVTLLLAGHETTASTLGWSFYLLGQHPEVMQRVHEEAVRVLGDRPPVYADLHELRYTSTVVEEVMRLYPPVWILPRLAQQEDEIGGYHVPAGSDVLISPYAMHRNPQFWDHPERFDPDRFDPANSTGRPRYAYLPFGAGPRFCVGNHLGMMEAVFTIAMVARELRLTPLPGYRAVPEAMLSLRLRDGLPMLVGDRN